MAMKHNPRRKRAINDPLVLQEYSRMRGKTGGVVGEDARRSLGLARARAEYKRRDDVEIEWMPEQDSYESVYGEKPPEGAEFYTVLVKIKGRVMASLGFVDDSSNEYMRIVENELLWEAFGEEKKGLGTYRHIPRHKSIRRNPRATAASSTGDAVAAHELYLFAINDPELYRQRIVPVINNLRKKVKKGIYRADLALKLWRYVADDAAKRYTHGMYGHGPGYGIFTVPIREAAARELAAHYASAVNVELATQVRLNPIKGQGKYEGELYVTRYAHDNDDESIGDVQELGWFGRFSGKIKGRGPFHIITQEDNQGFVYGQLFDTEKEMLNRWNEIESEYTKFTEEQSDE
jgi:hypothetical protein